MDDRRVRIETVCRERECEAGTASGARQHGFEALARARLIGQPVVDDRLRAEAAEKRRDTQQHERRGHRLGRA